MNEASQPTELMTVTGVAEHLGFKTHVVKYAIDTAGLEPVQRAGIVRLWHPNQLPGIKEAIFRTSRDAKQK